MLLCHELRDYTVFNLKRKTDIHGEESAKILVDEVFGKSWRGFIY